MMNGYKQGKVNLFVLLLTISLALNLEKWLPSLDGWIFFIISLILAAGFYEFVVWLILFIISNNDFCMRLYWGKEYLSGYWTYEYTRESKKYIGVWRIKQDLTSTSVVGSGLNDDFSIRTNVSSISPLICEQQGRYFVINKRTEINKENPNGHLINVYSKTSFTFDSPNSIFSEMITMRSITEIYGGKSNEHIHPDVVFHKHKKIKSIEGLIEKLKSGEIT